MHFVDFVVQWLNKKNCALFDKSTKFGTHVDYHQINIFGYGGVYKCMYSW